MTNNQRASKSRQQYVRLPLRVLKFLLGSAPLEGVWFMDPHPKKKGLYWWRSSYFGKHYHRIDRKGGRRGR